MRLTLRALVGLIVVGCGCCHARAEDERTWWPFRGAEGVEASEPAAAVAPDAASQPSVNPQAAAPPAAGELEPERRWMLNSPRGKVSWPRFHMPELPKPRLPRPQFVQRQQPHQVDGNRNAWAEQQPEPSRPTPLAAMSDASRRAGERTRAAWRKTVDALTPGDGAGSSPRVAQRDSRTPFWKRMFGGEEPQPQGPQTVTEWMAQDRLDP